MMQEKDHILQIRLPEDIPDQLDYYDRQDTIETIHDLADIEALEDVKMLREILSEIRRRCSEFI